jgi:hypothetical protein
VRRELAQRAAHIEERRGAALRAILIEAAELERLKRLLASVGEGIAGADDPRIVEFVRWANAHLAEREAALSAQGLAQRFERERLFGADDDHDFRPSRW